MRWIYLNMVLLAGLLTASGSSTTRDKRDINIFKNFFHSFLPGTSKVPSFSNTFRLRGHDNIRIRVVPRTQPKVQLNNSEEAELIPPPPPMPPIIGEVSSFLGTKTAEDTLKALDGMKNLLQSGVLDAKKEEIAYSQIDSTIHPATDVMSLISAEDLKKGDEIVFVEDMIQPIKKVVYKPATILFEHGFLVNKPKIQAVEVMPTKYTPASQYYYHQINNGGTTTYVETRPGGVMPAPPTLDDVKLPTITSDYLVLPPLANQNPFGLGIQETIKVTEESSSNMTQHPVMFLPEPQMIPLLPTASDVYVTDEISASQINRRPVMEIPEPPSLTEVIVPPAISYEETIQVENKPVKVLDIEEYPNRFSYSYVGKNGQTIIYRGSKYSFSISEPVYEHIIPMSLYPIADYHSVKEISSKDFAKSVPIRQPYSFSYGIGLPTRFSSPSSTYVAENDKGSKVEDIVMVPGPAPIREPYAFSYGVAMPPAMPTPIATVTAEADKQGAGYEGVVVIPGATPINQGYAFSYGIGMPPMMPSPQAPAYAAEVEKEVFAMPVPAPIRQPYAFSYGAGYGMGLPAMMPPPSASGYAAGQEDIVMVPGPAPIRQPYSFGYGVGMPPTMIAPVAAAVAADTNKQESGNEEIMMVPGSPGPIRQPYAFSYGVGMPPIMPPPSAPMPPMYSAEIVNQETEKEDASGPTFAYGVGMTSMMAPPEAAAINVQAEKQESENEEVMMMPGPAPARQPYAFSYGAGMPPMMPTTVASAVDVEVGKQESENEEVMMMPGPAPARQPYAFAYGAGMPSVLPSSGAPMSPMYAVEVEKHDSEDQDIVVPGQAPVRQPYAFGYGVGMSHMPSMAADTNKQESGNKIVMVSQTAPAKQSHAFGYGAAMTSPVYAPYAAHYVPYPYMQPIPYHMGQHYGYVNHNEEMYNSRYTQLYSGQVPPHILTRVQRLTNNPSGQVYGINPYTAYQPEQSMTNIYRRVPYVNNNQEYEPEFPEKAINNDENTNKDVAAEESYTPESQEVEHAENSEESMAPVQDSLDNTPIVVGDSEYDYRQMNSDGSSTHILGHGNDQVSIDVETTEESATSPYLGETVY